LLKRRIRFIGAECGDNKLPQDVSWKRSLTAEVMSLYKGILNVRIIREHITSPQKILLFLYVFQSTLRDVYVSPRKRQRVRRLKLIPEVVDVSRYIGTKIEAVNEYRSQVYALFGDIEVFRQSMERYSVSISGTKGCYVERYWRAQ